MSFPDWANRGEENRANAPALAPYLFLYIHTHAAATRHRLCQDMDTGINRRGLRREAIPLGHGNKLVDAFPCGRLPKHERPAAEVVAVLGLVP